MPRRKEPRIPDAILDQLLAGADPKTAFDPNGLLDGLRACLKTNYFTNLAYCSRSAPWIPEREACGWPGGWIWRLCEAAWRPDSPAEAIAG